MNHQPPQLAVGAFFSHDFSVLPTIFRPLPKGRLCYNTISLKGVSNGETKKLHPLSLKLKLFSKSQRCDSPSRRCRRHNLNENQLSQWKRQLLENAPMLFESTDKHPAMPRSVSLTLSSSLGEWAVALDIQKKLLTGLD